MKEDLFSDHVSGTDACGMMEELELVPSGCPTR